MDNCYFVTFSKTFHIFFVFHIHWFIIVLSIFRSFDCVRCTDKLENKQRKAINLLKLLLLFFALCRCEQCKNLISYKFADKIQIKNNSSLNNQSQIWRRSKNIWTFCILFYPNYLNIWRLFRNVKLDF